MSNETPILSALGLYGLDSIEEPILAGLVTGDPVLLIGAHGTAKTTLVERLAESLQETFIAYDASKALFEDVIGFPNPKSITKGIVDYVPTAISVWGKTFVLIDEISRGAPSMQNKWLEIVRSRRVMGLPIPGLRYVFAAMNPPTYDGAYPLDPALAGRFAFIIQMPDACDMGQEEVQAITRSKHNGDAPALNETAHAPNNLEARTYLVTLLSLARDLYPVVENDCGPGLSRFLYRFNHALFTKNRDLALDGRRLGLMYRGILAILALRAARSGEIPDPRTLAEGSNLSSMISFMLPYSAMSGSSPSPFAIETAVTWAMNEKSDPIPMIPAASILSMVKDLIAGKEIPTAVVPKLLQTTLENLGHVDLEHRVEAAATLAYLAPLIADGTLDVPSSWKARIIRAWRLWTRVTPGMLEDGDLKDVIAMGPLMDAPNGELDSRLALLLALHVSQDHDELVLHHSGVYAKKVIDAYNEIATRFDQINVL